MSMCVNQIEKGGKVGQFKKEEAGTDTRATAFTRWRSRYHFTLARHRE
jgi:hypothetical protein